MFTMYQHRYTQKVAVVNAELALVTADTWLYVDVYEEKD